MTLLSLSRNITNKSMYKNFVLVLLLPLFALGDETCDRKEMLDTICSLCAQRTGNPANQQIAFFAYMSKNILIKTLSKHKAFVYDRIETNVGNAYNSATGKFTAPGDGMYFFQTTTTVFNRSYCTIEIVKNGAIKDIGIADAGSIDDRALSSTMTILRLKKGDVVHVRTGVAYGGNYVQSDQYARTTFSGFKLV